MNGKNQSILLSGVVCGVLTALVSLIPFLGSCLCCLALAGAGVMTVWHFTNSQESDVFMTSGEGAGSGALAGVLAGIIYSLLVYALLASGVGPGIDEVLAQMEQQGQMGSEELEMVEGIMRSPWLFVALGVMSAIGGALLGALGGALGVNWFAKKAA